MKYIAPIGAADPNDPYIDGNPGAGIEGSAVPAAAIEDAQREIVNVIEEAGLVPDDGDLTQLYQALLIIIAAAIPSGPALATTALAGIVELATTAEIRSGTVDKVLDAAGLLAALGVSNHYNSGQQAFVAAGGITLAHGMARRPKLITYSFECLIAEHGYAVGEFVDVIASNSGTNSNIQWGITSKFDATNIVLIVGSSGIIITHATTGVRSTLTPANWRLIVDAWA